MFLFEGGEREAGPYYYFTASLALFAGMKGIGPCNVLHEIQAGFMATFASLFKGYRCRYQPL
jgi:hypothetical protein